MYVSGTWLLRILAQDRWIQVLHVLHSIMARPAKGFMQKQVTRSHESSSGKTGGEGRKLDSHTVTLYNSSWNWYIYQCLTGVDHDVLILSWSVFISENYLLPLAEDRSAPRGGLRHLHLHGALLQVPPVPAAALLRGLLLAVWMAGQPWCVGRMQRDGDVVIRLLFDGVGTQRGRVVQLWGMQRWGMQQGDARFPGWAQPLLLPVPLPLLQFVRLFALVRVKPTEHMLQRHVANMNKTTW